MANSFQFYRCGTGDWSGLQKRTGLDYVLTVVPRLCVLVNSRPRLAQLRGVARIFQTGVTLCRSEGSHQVVLSFSPPIVGSLHTAIAPAVKRQSKLSCPTETTRL